MSCPGRSRDPAQRTKLSPQLQKSHTLLRTAQANSWSDRGPPSPTHIISPPEKPPLTSCRISFQTYFHTVSNSQLPLAPRFPPALPLRTTVRRAAARLARAPDQNEWTLLFPSMAARSPEWG